MAKEPKAVFILSDSGFTEIFYAEFNEKYKSDNSYMDSHFFIRLGDCLMEVTATDYQEHYRARRRQKYLDELATENGDVSFDALTTSEFNGEDALPDTSKDVAEQISHKLMLDKLRECLPLLSENEQFLIHQHFFENMSQVELSRIYGMNQSSVSRRITKILLKLKKLLES